MPARVRLKQKDRHEGGVCVSYVSDVPHSLTQDRSAEGCISINIGLPVTISCQVSLCFSKGVMQTVSKATGNTLDQDSPVALISLEILSLRIPLVLLTLLDD